MSENMLNVIIYGSLAIALMLSIFGIEAKVKRTEVRLKRIELSLDLLLEKWEIEVPSPLSARVQELALDPRQKLAAVKLYRTETGAGLKEALAAIEEFIANNANHHR
jgi:hypothetical protein